MLSPCHHISPCHLVIFSSCDIIIMLSSSLTIFFASIYNSIACDGCFLFCLHLPTFAQAITLALPEIASIWSARTMTVKTSSARGLTSGPSWAVLKPAWVFPGSKTMSPRVLVTLINNLLGHLQWLYHAIGHAIQWHRSSRRRQAIVACTRRWRHTYIVSCNMLYTMP